MWGFPVRVGRNEIGGFEIAYFIHQSDVERDGMFMRDICSSVEVLVVLKMRWTGQTDCTIFIWHCSYLSSSIHSDVMIALQQ